MENLIKKFKKVGSKQIEKRIEAGKLDGDNLKAALEVLTLRGIEINNPAADLVKAPETTPTPEKKKRNPATVTLETFTNFKEFKVGQKVKIYANRRNKEKVVEATINRIFSLNAIPGQEEARLNDENGKRYYRFPKEFMV